MWIKKKKIKKMESPKKLYDICLENAVAVAIKPPNFHRKEFRLLPNIVLFDFYYLMFQEKRLCLLALEYGNLEVFSRLLNVTHNRVKLLKSFQTLIDHCSNMPEELLYGFTKYLENKETCDMSVIDLGLKVATFLNEGGWFNYSLRLLNDIEQLCLKHKQDANLLKKLLDCYYKRIYAEAIFCEFEEAKVTFKSAQNVIEELKKLNDLPNLAGIYANFSLLFFMRSEYDLALQWSKKAVELLQDDLPSKVVIDVLRQASKSCVVKRRFEMAGMLIRHAEHMASILYSKNEHPYYSDVLLDYGYYLVNFDSIKESVKIYTKSLQIRKNTFDKNNIHVALAHEDLGYALYVNEYNSGRFLSAFENVERSIRIMERILPKDHLLLASVKRVKALILEEMALDLRDRDPELQKEHLKQAEELHLAALKLTTKAFGDKNVQTAKHLGNLGRLYQTMKMYEDAEKMHLRAIAIKEELLGKNDCEVSLSVGHLASLYNYHMMRHLDAEQLYKRSIQIHVNLFGLSYSGLGYDYRGLVYCYTNLGEPYKAIEYKQKEQEWKRLRNEIKPYEPTGDILTIDELKQIFLNMSES